MMIENSDTDSDSTIELHVRNPQNKLIDETYINNIFKKYNVKYRIKNLETFQVALTHISYLKVCLNKSKKKI